MRYGHDTLEKPCGFAHRYPYPVLLQRRNALHPFNNRKDFLGLGGFPKALDKLFDGVKFVHDLYGCFANAPRGTVVF